MALIPLPDERSTVEEHLAFWHLAMAAAESMDECNAIRLARHGAGGAEQVQALQAMSDLMRKVASRANWLWMPKLGPDGPRKGKSEGASHGR